VISQTCMIINELGLHARAATKLVQLASKYPCDVEIAHGGQRANAKSVMGVLLLCSGKGSQITLTASGEREQECLNALAALVADYFGEGK
jgi:phosphocarrier protein HPr